MANELVNGGKIARKISGGGGSSGIVVPRQIESRLSQLQGGGQPMPSSLRSQMESGFGRDLSQVRLHTDSNAVSMSSSIHAKAFTFGNDIYFNHGQFSPETTEGQHLVAHELTHVVQGTGKVGREENKEPSFWEKNTVQNPNTIDETFKKEVLLDAKSLAKEMVSKSIAALTKMENEGKDLSLFYYCFDRQSYKPDKKDNKPDNNKQKSEKKRSISKETKGRIAKVRKNYDRILKVLSSKDDLLKSDNPSLPDQRIIYKLTADWGNLKQVGNNRRLATAAGFAYMRNGQLEEKLIELEKEKKARRSLPAEERSKMIMAQERSDEPSASDLNTVFLRFTDDSSGYYIKKSKDGKRYEYNWSHRLRLASTIIHELSHRVCGTDDHSYLEAGETIPSANKLTENASSYEVFSAWVESTIYSVFEANFKDNSSDWNIETYDGFTDHGIPRPKL